MKKKPDLSSFQRQGLTKDPSSFLEDAVADRAEKPAGTKPARSQAKAAGPATVQKIFRLPADVALGLKMDAAEQSVATGRRVTELEIVERLLRDHLQLSR